LLYLNVTILPIVITLMVVCYVIIYQIIIIKKEKTERKKKAIKHRGVLAAVKLGHTRIFIVYWRYNKSSTL
jgi:4-hydroxybenzoate polyprenyltransferase